MDRQTLCDWVYRYNVGGLAGLSNRTAEQRPYLAPEGGTPRSFARVLTLRWTAWCVGRRIDLKHLIKERGVVMHERTVGKSACRTWVQAAFGAPRTSSIGSGRTGGRSKKNFAQARSGGTAA